MRSFLGVIAVDAINRCLPTRAAEIDGNWFVVSQEKPGFKAVLLIAVEFPAQGKLANQLAAMQPKLQFPAAPIDVVWIHKGDVGGDARLIGNRDDAQKEFGVSAKCVCICSRDGTYQMIDRLIESFQAGTDIDLEQLPTVEELTRVGQENGAEACPEFLLLSLRHQVFRIVGAISLDIQTHVQTKSESALERARAGSANAAGKLRELLNSPEYQTLGAFNLKELTKGLEELAKGLDGFSKKELEASLVNDAYKVVKDALDAEVKKPSGSGA